MNHNFDSRKRYPLHSIDDTNQCLNVSFRDKKKNSNLYDFLMEQQRQSYTAKGSIEEPVITNRSVTNKIYSETKHKLESKFKINDIT